MPSVETNLAERSGNLVETHKGYQPRVVFFYLVIVFLLVVLVTGLAYQQLFRTDIHRDVERVQNQRRILVPGPRGNIYDRNGTLLVGNRPRLAVVLYLGELRREIRRQYLGIRKAYRDSADNDLPGMPSADEMMQIARTSTVQRYLDQVNGILGRREKVDTQDLDKHFVRQLLLPYVLIEDLEPEEYARLLERLPVHSPLQVYTSSARYYPYGSAASQTLGYVGIDPDLQVEDFPGEDLKTFKMKGSIGRDGIEKQFDAALQGEAGGTIFRVDPAGYKINPPLDRRPPVQGKNLVTSLDIDLQLAAEKTLRSTGDGKPGAAVAIDINTGEVLVLSSNPDYDLNDFSPRLSHRAAAEIESKGAWNNRAVNGLYPPGSTFKVLTSIAGFRTGVITPQSTYETNGTYLVGTGAGRRAFRDHRGCVQGEIDFSLAIQQSVNTYFINYGLLAGPESIYAEAKRFRLTVPTGIELPAETRSMYVGNDEWKRARDLDGWRGGDTANLTIGQGYIQVTPLQMACFTASVARGETTTQPYLLHDPTRPRQKSESIGLTAVQSRALLDAMERVVTNGTARLINAPKVRIEGLTIAAKTGTAQKDAPRKEGQPGPGKIELAWIIAFAPAEKPEIAVAVVIEGDTPDESYGGGQYAAPVAHAIFKAWWEKKSLPRPATLARSTVSR